MFITTPMINQLNKEFIKSSGKLRDLRKHNHVNDSIINEFGPEVSQLITSQVNTEDDKTLVIMTNSNFNVNSLSDNFFKAIVNLERINDIQNINNFFEAVNQKLPINGVYISCMETKGLRKKRIMRKYPFGIAHIYYLFDFVFKRIFPKLPVTKTIYLKITAGRNRVLSRTESMGRLYSCGFSVLHERFIGNYLFFVAQKIKEPSFDQEASYGPIYKMKRVGKQGKIIHVYKVRTMHAYAEYLQQYIYEKNSLEEGGKFKDDFRISTLGKFFRKYWLDELPMLLNLLKGDLKLVGVRPLSKHYLSLYSEELINLRLKYKPGLIPPFYVDMPKTLNEIMESELNYLRKYEKSPILTDVKYFFGALNNIIIKKARSK